MSICACHGMDFCKVKNPDMPWTDSRPLGIGSGHAQQHRPSALCSIDVHYIAHVAIDLTGQCCQTSTKLKLHNFSGQRFGLLDSCLQLHMKLACMQAVSVSCIVAIKTCACM